MTMTSSSRMILGTAVVVLVALFAVLWIGSLRQRSALSALDPEMST
jgi:hypothetical protein